MAAEPLSVEEKQKHSQLGVVSAVSCRNARSYDQFLIEAFGEGAKAFFDWASKDKPEKVVHNCRLINGHHFIIDDADLDFLTSEHLGLDDVQQAKVSLYLNVEDAFAIEAKALEQGATSLVKVAAQFWGANYGIFRDPHGIIWALSSGSQSPTFSPSANEIDNLVPELHVDNAAAELQWIQDVFGATLVGEPHKHDGKIMHSVLDINRGGRLYVCDVFDHSTRPSVDITLSLLVPAGEASSYADRLSANGGRITMPVGLQFWGAIYGRVIDRFGQQWAFCEPHKPHDAESPAKKSRQD